MSSIALPQPTWRRWFVLLPLALGVGMVGIDASIVSVANATIGRELHASLAGLQWVTNAYLLALCSLLLNAGRIADRIGRKRAFMIGIAGFGLSSAGCALAGSTGQLIAWRAIQGAAGAMLMPSSLAILRATFSDRELDRAIGAWAATATSSVVAGPIVGGLLVEHVSWQSVFLINLPVALVAVLGTSWFALESRGPAGARDLDLPGFALGGAGLFVLVFALIKAQSHGWGSLYTIGLFAAATVLLAAFVVRERTAAEPMLPLGLFRSRPLSVASVLTVVTYFALYGVLFFWTLYLQRVLGDSPLTSGVQLLPLTAGFVVMSPLAGWIGARFGTRVSLLAGLLGIAAGSVVLTRVQIADGYGAVWPAFLLLGASLSLAAIAGVQTMMSNAPLRFAGVAGAVMTTACQLGGVLGIAVLGSVLGSHTAAPQLALHAGLTPQLAAAAGARAFLAGLHAAMWVVAGVALAGSLLAPLARRGEGEVGPAHLV
jgi:EmrB/QacA subfamily drug resistance transporter